MYLTQEISTDECKLALFSALPMSPSKPSLSVEMNSRCEVGYMYPQPVHVKY